MITKDIDAIVFNIFDYKENDLIVDVFTREYGFMQLYVRGAQKTTSKSFFIFKVFNIISIDLSKINLDELSIYRSGSVLKVFDYTALNYGQMNAVMLLSETLLKIKNIKDYNINLYYNELETIITRLVSDKEVDALFLVNYFFLKTLDILGCSIILDCCGHCTKSSNIVVFDLDEKCFICKDCYNGDLNAIVNPDVLNYLYNLGRGHTTKSSNLSLNKVVFELLYDILLENAGIYLVSHDYI